MSGCNLNSGEEKGPAVAYVQPALVALMKRKICVRYGMTWLRLVESYELIFRVDIQTGPKLVLNAK